MVSVRRVTTRAKLRPLKTAHPQNSSTSTTVRTHSPLDTLEETPSVSLTFGKTTLYQLTTPSTMKARILFLGETPSQLPMSNQEIQSLLYGLVQAMVIFSGSILSRSCDCSAAAMIRLTTTSVQLHSQISLSTPFLPTRPLRQVRRIKPLPEKESI